MTADVTVLTASLPERASMLAEAVASVAAQDLAPRAHLISIDLHRNGAVPTYNDLAGLVQTEWLTFLDDDDMLLPDHLSTLWGAREDVEVVYAGCEATGGSFDLYSVPFDHVTLERRSIVPVTAMVRTEWFFKVGGFPDVWGYDWRLWQRLSSAGARFRQQTERTWVYRFHGANQSRGEL